MFLLSLDSYSKNKHILVYFLLTVISYLWLWLVSSF